jgi:Domain of unknown function (DUF4389)
MNSRSVTALTKGEQLVSYPVTFEADYVERRSRLTTFFRLILAIPLEIGVIAAWFVIVITGKLPRGLFEVMVLATSYTVRSDAYLALLTETYPPFQDEQTRAAGTQEPPASPAPEYPSLS